ncbi:MAG: cysteine desulfurase [Saprospiraceae bacterium]|nr:cysteine desulfurase [Saprospiraceae bacterium]
MRVYFDNAATTPLCPVVVDAMTQCMLENYGNPSSIHAEGRKARALIEDARKTVAHCMSASIGEIFFTSGGTESNNTAIKCAVRDLDVTRIITSQLEHHCVLHSVQSVEAFNKVLIEFVNVDETGKPDLQHLQELLSDRSHVTLVSLMHANNEIGTLSDIKAIGELCKEYDAYFHSDSVQTVGHFPINVQEINVHFLSGAAHKFHGPKGIGFLYINNKVKIKPFLDGGAQERNMRGGTENVYGIVGLAKALQLAHDEYPERRKKIEEVRNYFRKKLVGNFDDVAFNGDVDGESLYTVLNVSFPASSKSDLLLMILDISGVSASGGSACSSGADAGSHVLNHLPKCNKDRKSIRFSFSHYNTLEEVDFAIEKIKSILPQPVAI